MKTNASEQTAKNRAKIKELEAQRYQMQEHINQIKKDLVDNQAAIHCLEYGMREGTEFIFNGEPGMIVEMGDMFPKYVSKKKDGTWSKTEKWLFVHNKDYEIIKY